ncbi:hypothetical protein [Paenibacillus sp. URB8-2]|uniref:hypothetical protein n=1 Tax=Paenibacillus sp. URB8-2 TaxID=2741301 RepID=UPI0015BFE34A|nr:hypothetical protein [Paenibacillus sp. URB8-2]BCG59447.1 hypothetical protein PUR_28720 [Paenibacillus sp. URB8-2]
MSWDVTFMKLNMKVSSVEDIDDEMTEELGNREEIINMISKLFPDADFSDPSWGLLEQPGYSVEFNIPEENNITEIMLHIRGDETSIEVIRKIHDNTSWAAIDEEIIDFNNSPEKGLKDWQNARDLLIKEVSTRKKKWYEFWK